MAEFTYPKNSELSEIAQDLVAVLTRDDPIFDILPIRSVDASLVEWEQGDNYVGLQQIRGLEGEPLRVKRVGLKRFAQQPGVFGEFLRIGETELTTRRAAGTYNQPISLDDLVMRLQEQLLTREINLIKKIGWNLVALGQFSVIGPGGVVMLTGEYEPQTYDALVDWGTPGSATPLQDFRNIALLGRGTSSKFGAGATAYMNQETFNKLISNTNAADLYGRRTSGLANVLSLNDTNALLMGEGLPKIEIYDDGYLDDAGDFQLYIPADSVVVVGQRPGGAMPGEYQMVRNASNRNMEPGPYDAIVDSLDTGTPIPRTIDVHRGHNGAPALQYPSQIVIVDTTGAES